MSWSITDHEEHECYIVPIFADGTRGLSILSGPIGSGVIVQADYSQRDSIYTRRPESEVTGWVVLCNYHREGHGWDSEPFTGPTFNRVPARFEDVSAYNVAAEDLDVETVADRADVEAVALGWFRRHVETDPTHARRTSSEATR